MTILAQNSIIHIITWKKLRHHVLEFHSVFNIAITRLLWRLILRYSSNGLSKMLHHLGAFKTTLGNYKILLVSLKYLIVMISIRKLTTRQILYEILIMILILLNTSIITIKYRKNQKGTSKWTRLALGGEN